MAVRGRPLWQINFEKKLCDIMVHSKENWFHSGDQPAFKFGILFVQNINFLYIKFH